MGHSEQNYARRNIFPPVLEGTLFLFFLFFEELLCSLQTWFPEIYIREDVYHSHVSLSPCNEVTVVGAGDKVFAPVSSRGAPSLSEVHLQLTPVFILCIQCLLNAVRCVFKRTLNLQAPLPTTVTHCEMLQVQEKLCSQ